MECRLRSSLKDRVCFGSSCIHVEKLAGHDGEATAQLFPKVVSQISPELVGYMSLDSTV